MDGIILFNKEKNMTSRDVCNMVAKKLNIKRIGHTGTLDPLATGLMVLCINEGCKLQEELTGHDKDYIVKVRLGIKTDTYDITGNIIKEDNNYSLNKEQLLEALNSFTPGYFQKVPIYSAVKVNGKKLYEYARSNMEVSLPVHEVKISNINILEFEHDSFTFSVTVSSGTYIRSLVNDLSDKLKICMTMEELKRTRIGNFKLERASSLDNLKIIPIIDAVFFDKYIIDDDILYKKVRNGVKIENTFGKNKILFIKDNKPIAIYKKDENNLLKSYRVFNIKE